jgi:hypothetical protein
MLVATAPRPARAADDDVLLEFHFKPVDNAQIAIWLEDEEGNFVRDVFVTQATGTLGIGNRPGLWNFLSSYRFPYGPRTGVLPVWAHARGHTYPALTFHDPDASDQESLGWHENSSSPEPYFCRPLSEADNETYMDAMTCPSPSTFQSDKGMFSGADSVYPPRGDLTSYEDGHDHADVHMLAELNDLDAISGATPAGYAEQLITTVIPAAEADGPLVAKLEINIENDQNADWTFSRDGDHYVDPRLSGFGIPYLGQPSIVYSVKFDPAAREFTSTDLYAGYGDLDGATGDVHLPDETISTSDGSGADRLQLFEKNNRTFRFGVFSHGPGGMPGGGDPGDDGGWGSCMDLALPTMTGVEFEPLDFDRVRVHFTVPDYGGQTEIKQVRLFYRIGDMPLDDSNASAAIQQVPTADRCGGPIEPGATTYCDVEELFGSTNYQIGIRYEDNCSNSSDIVSDEITTPQQEFATVEGLCFVATAAWGAPWQENVTALRWFRDLVLKQSSLGWSAVAFYYTHGPVLAKLIHGSPLARAIARAHLEPFAIIARAFLGPQGLKYLAQATK